MTSKSKSLVVAIVSSIAMLLIPAGSAQQVSGPFKVVQVTGLTGVKDHTKGSLDVENGQLHFVHSKASFDVSAASIQGIATRADSERAVGGTVGVMTMAAPYGGGRFLSLFRKKIDTLTVQYRDSDGGLHGTIFTMPVGAAELIKKALEAQGARTTAPGEATASAITAPSATPPNKEQNQ